jgi:microcystin synthetase protein McyJ
VLADVRLAERHAHPARDHGPLLRRDRGAPAERTAVTRLSLSEDVRSRIRRVREAVAEPLSLLRAPGDVAAFYDLYGDDVVRHQDQQTADPGKPLWFNLGYWREARRFPDACRALALELGRAAAIGRGDRVLDAGFGFAESVFVWLDDLGAAEVVGVNLTASQVEVARARVAARGLASRARLLNASATELPLPASSFDKVVALESAFHFRTRERFFAEAHRVLRPGGVLALADIVGRPQRTGRTWSHRLKRYVHRIPEANAYDSVEYLALLRRAGFVNVTWRSIREHVFPAFARYEAARRGGQAMADIQVTVTDVERARCTGTEPYEALGMDDYGIAVARKAVVE